MGFSEEVLRFITDLDKPFADENKQSVDHQITDTKELGETFKSLAFVTFCVVMIHFFTETIRLSSHIQYWLSHYSRVFWDHGGSRNPIGFAHLSRIELMFVTHFFALYSTYLSLYYLYIPVLSLLTTQYIIGLFLRTNLEYDRKTRNWLLSVKTLVLVYLWSFGLIWSTLDKQILDVYYSELRVGHTLVSHHKNYFLLMVVFFLSSIGIQFCWIGATAQYHFLPWIDSISNLFEYLL